MENQQNSSPLDQAASHSKGITLSTEAENYLKETSKWSKFLAILGFCGVGLIVLVGLFSGTIVSSLGQQSQMPFPGFALGIIYLVMGAIYFFPLYYLFKFSTNVRSAITNGDNNQLNIAFKNLKSHYKYIGILMAVLICFYVVIGAGAFIFADLFR